jgi:cation transport ATPase
MNNALNEKSQRRKIIAGVIVVFLMLPVIGMMISENVNWSIADFVIAAILLSIGGLGVDLIFSKLKTRRARILTLMIVFVLFALVWGELAVGLFGTPWAGN